VSLGQTRTPHRYQPLRSLSPGPQVPPSSIRTRCSQPLARSGFLEDREANASSERAGRAQNELDRDYVVRPDARAASMSLIF
jgi:hypothetical protein